MIIDSHHHIHNKVYLETLGKPAFSFCGPKPLFNTS